MTYSHFGIFEQLRAALDERPTRTLSEVAYRLHVHRHTAATAVRVSTGDGFRAWRDHGLFERAAGLLRTHHDLSIKEISARLGFSSTRSFDRFIKRYSGLSPTQIRLTDLDRSSLAE